MLPSQINEATINEPPIADHAQIRQRIDIFLKAPKNQIAGKAHPNDETLFVTLTHNLVHGVDNFVVAIRHRVDDSAYSYLFNGTSQELAAKAYDEVKSP